MAPSPQLLAMRIRPNLANGSGALAEQNSSGRLKMPLLRANLAFWRFHLKAPCQWAPSPKHQLIPTHPHLSDEKATKALMVPTPQLPAMRTRTNLANGSDALAEQTPSGRLQVLLLRANLAFGGVYT